jgi:hypothetical protein
VPTTPAALRDRFGILVDIFSLPDHMVQGPVRLQREFS